MYYVCCRRNSECAEFSRLPLESARNLHPGFAFRNLARQQWSLRVLSE